jgi:transposase
LQVAIDQQAIGFGGFNKAPKTVKQAWLIKLVQRAGLKRSCIALANKTVRTAWAMLRYENKYEQQQLVTI